MIALPILLCWNWYAGFPDFSQTELSKENERLSSKTRVANRCSITTSARLQLKPSEKYMTFLSRALVLKKHFYSYAGHHLCSSVTHFVQLAGLTCRALILWFCWPSHITHRSRHMTTASPWVVISVLLTRLFRHCQAWIVTQSMNWCLRPPVSRDKRFHSMIGQ